MNTYTKMLPQIQSKEYDTFLWNALRGRHNPGNTSIDLSVSAAPLSATSQDKYGAAVKKESLFRNLATTILAYEQEDSIKTTQT